MEQVPLCLCFVISTGNVAKTKIVEVKWKQNVTIQEMFRIVNCYTFILFRCKKSNEREKINPQNLKYLYITLFIIS